MTGSAATVSVAPRTLQRTGWSLPKVHTLLAIGPIGPSSGASVYSTSLPTFSSAKSASRSTSR